VKLFGMNLTRRELQQWIGRMEQVAGIRRAELADGRERGVRIADVHNGGGLRFTVLLDRGMDIGDAEFAGIPLAYLTAGEYAHPSYFDDDGLKWLRSWGGGLLTGCGLRNVGAPCATEDESFPLHGRLSNAPARNVRCVEEWDGAECTLAVEGDLSEARLFGENLRLHRRIAVRVGSNEIEISDTIENAGFEPEPVFILYHTNWGFPVVYPGAVLEAVPHEVEPRDADAAEGLDEWMKMQPPTPGYREQVFYHDIPADADGMSTLRLRSPQTGLLVEVRAQKDVLPYFIQWKMMGQGAYVTGIEPSNCRVGGRCDELERGPHCILQPGDKQLFRVVIRISPIDGD